MTLRKRFPILTAALLLGGTVFAADAPVPPREPLWPQGAPDGRGGTSTNENAYVTFHPAPHPNGKAVVICPGGGYGGLVTGAEGHGIAQWLNAHGIHGLVLEYRLPAGRDRVPLLDAQRAIRLLRQRAKEWSVDPRQVGIIGFSAGGHLAATASTQFDDGDSKATDRVARQGSRPDFTLLVYPVITFGPGTHSGTRGNLLGPDPSADLVRRYSCELQVTDRTPPAFLAHAVDDTAVPISNSRIYRDALKSHGVPVQLLELPNGGHGLNGYRGPSWDAWQEAARVWLQAR